MRPVTYLESPDMRREVLTAVKSLAEIVGKTLGPGGRPILLQQEGRPPLSTKVFEGFFIEIESLTGIMG